MFERILITGIRISITGISYPIHYLGQLEASYLIGYRPPHLFTSIT